MDTDTLPKLAKILAHQMLLKEFRANKKHSVSNWAYSVDFNALKGLGVYQEVADLVLENKGMFVDMLNSVIDKKLKYMYDEGFLRKEEDYYIVLTKKEVEEGVRQLEKTND